MQVSVNNKDQYWLIFPLQSKVLALAVLAYEFNPGQLEKLLSNCSPTDLQISEKAYFCGKCTNYWRISVVSAQTIGVGKSVRLTLLQQFKILKRFEMFRFFYILTKGIKCQNFKNRFQFSEV